MTNTKTPGQWCTIDEAAAYWVCSRDTIRRLIRNGDLEARKLGKSVRVSVASLEAMGKPMTVVGTR